MLSRSVRWVSDSASSEVAASLRRDQLAKPEATMTPTAASTPSNVRRMESGDLDFIVREHQERFPDGFFVRLGPRFLTEYYRSFLTGPHARGCVAELAGERVGFLVGVLDPTAHRSHVIKRHGRALTVVASTALMLSPALAWHFLRTRARRYIRRLVALSYPWHLGDQSFRAAPRRSLPMYRSLRQPRREGSGRRSSPTS